MRQRPLFRSNSGEAMRARIQIVAPYAPVGLFGSHRPTSPIGSGVQTLRFRRDPPEVRALSGRVCPALAGPIRPITGRRSLSPALLYPLRRHPPLRSGFRLAAGRVGLTLLPDGEIRPGRLRPFIRRALSSPSPTAPFGDPARLPFGSGHQPLGPALRSRTLADVRLRSAYQSPLGPTRIVAPRPRPIVPGARHVGSLLRTAG